MWTEAALVKQMRSAVRDRLPARAFLKRDRDAELLVSNAPVFDPGLNEIPGFLLRRSGNLLHILPDSGWISLLEERHPQAPDALSASLIRFRNARISRENLLLFARGCKLIDEGSAAAPAEAEAFDRSIRQRAALALRGECGGGLYACAILNAALKTEKDAQSSGLHE